MKKHLPLLIALLLFTLVLTSCQPSPTETAVIEEPQGSSEENTSQDQTDIETAYPAVEEAPSQITSEMDSAYPITEDDLELLYRTWELSVYSEDGIDQDPMAKTLQFRPDGRYEMTTTSGTTTGNWTARLFAQESTLILNNDSEETLTFTIVDLEEGLLNLRSWREETQIDEQFLPTD